MPKHVNFFGVGTRSLISPFFCTRFVALKELGDSGVSFRTPGYRFPMGISNATRFDLDRCILEFDRAVRILYGEPVARQPSPAEVVAEEDLRDEVRRDAAALMRVKIGRASCRERVFITV